MTDKTIRRSTRLAGKRHSRIQSHLISYVWCLNAWTTDPDQSHLNSYVWTVKSEQSRLISYVWSVIKNYSRTITSAQLWSDTDTPDQSKMILLIRYSWSDIKKWVWSSILMVSGWLINKVGDRATFYYFYLPPTLKPDQTLGKKEP